ncbi:MAG: hypothetical protein Q7S37_00265 [bacterium]|nr:hypothetical protein [bacterium]
MSLEQILFLIAFGIVWLVVMVFIIKRFIWINKTGKALSKTSEDITSRTENMMAYSNNLLKGNVMTGTQDIEFSQLTKANRILTKVDIKGTIGYYQNNNLAALGNLVLSYSYMDNHGSSLNGVFSIYDGSNNNIKANINNGLVELFKNDNHMAILDIPNRKVFNVAKEAIATIDGNLLGGGQWVVNTVDKREICKLSASRSEWANSINKLDLKIFQKASEDQSEQGIINFFESLTKEANLRWSMLPHNYDLNNETEEIKISVIFLSTILYVLYMSTYRPSDELS